MGHQVNFFVLPADMAALEATIRKTGDVCFLEHRSPAPEPVELPALAFGPGERGHRPLGIELVRREDLGKVVMRRLGDQDQWIVKGSESPVVELDRCFFDGMVLRRGRAYFASDLRFRPELPDPDFVKWGDQVLNRIRKLLVRVPELSPHSYFSPSAADWIGQHCPEPSQRGDLEFRATGS